MRIQRMREFIAIKEQGNISRAARSLFMTQPALSRHVQEMEGELGVRLLDRDKHSVTLTEPGERAYRGFKQILRAYDRMADDLAGFKLGQTGKLRIGMLYYTIREDFGDAMERFKQEYPNVELKRFSYQPHEVFDALIEDRIDIGVMPRADCPGGESLRFLDIGSERLAVMMAPSHPLAGNGEISLDELHEQTTILLRDDPVSNLCYSQALERFGFVQRDYIYTDNVDTVPFALEGGKALYIAPHGLTIPWYDGEIVVRPIAEKGLRVSKSFAWRADNDNPLIPLFLEMAKRPNTA